MAFKSDNFSFEPVETHEASPMAPIAEAVPSSSLHVTVSEDNEEPSNTAVMIGCGLVGWVVCGPFLALMTALGGAYAAERNKGPIGETSKAIGRIAAAAGKKAREEHLWCKLKAAVRSLFQKRNCNCASCRNSGCTANSK
mmetsp:Transcript_6601/g.14309  ORF Transcript_6601/g.14309 Transcript_6601/m.14309 type:complete len:140 (+) Transcript_6601:223-642(+)